MSPTYTAPRGRHRQLFVPAYAESVPLTPPPPLAPPPPQDPPIYRELMRLWADRGLTLPGRHDPEWTKLAAPQVRPGQFSESTDPLGEGR
ncbi:hypothetical protein OG562_06160 [Streptomyces sp. NBC_01275]|uniref:hypothetical protein n=1 Tax=Streptomyces sp. NBC_01275 TaxID=2903807 RepID=UPI00224E336F|nr:hypothetical protein [Streptomyces sp. NBC_01275]MCX4760555.1 hypothetical protein [Streptomyces sp. NBC_01275]